MRKFLVNYISLIGLVVSALLPPVQAAEQTAKDDKEKVAGIGGVFFKAKDPKALAKWYQDNLGISPVPTNYDDSPWVQQGGETVFAPFSEKTTYFGRESQRWMINFRVNNLKKLVSQLEADGIKVEVDPQEYPNGYFARLHDPEGNPIELWQPK